MTIATTWDDPAYNRLYRHMRFSQDEYNTAKEESDRAEQAAFRLVHRTKALACVALDAADALKKEKERRISVETAKETLSANHDLVEATKPAIS